MFFFQCGISHALQDEPFVKNSFHIDHMKMISPQCVLSGCLKDKLNKKNSSHNDYMEMVLSPVWVDSLMSYGSRPVEKLFSQ